MSHWYDEVQLKTRLTTIQNKLGYLYTHKGESLVVYDKAGIVVRLTRFEQGMDFARVVESVMKICNNKEIEALALRLSEEGIIQDAAWAPNVNA